MLFAAAVVGITNAVGAALVMTEFAKNDVPMENLPFLPMFISFAYLLLQVALGVMLLVKPPAICLRLTTPGLVVFTGLAAVAPILSWIPLLIPAFKSSHLLHQSLAS